MWTAALVTIADAWHDLSVPHRRHMYICVSYDIGILVSPEKEENHSIHEPGGHHAKPCRQRKKDLISMWN